MPTTTPLSLPVPSDTDPVSDGALAVRNLANALDRKIIRKSLDETVVSSAAVQDDDVLQFAVEAGKSYSYDAFLLWGCASAAVDARVSFSHPGGTHVFGPGACMDIAAASSIGSNSYSGYAPDGGGSAIGMGVAASVVTVGSIHGTYVCTTTGTFKLRWAQWTASASGLTLCGGSRLRVERI